MKTLYRETSDDLKFLASLFLLASLIVGSGVYTGCGCVPEPKPVPVPPVVVPDPPKPANGPRHVVVLREASNQSPEASGAMVLLQTGERAKYLTDHKHKLSVLDDDLDEAKPYLAAANGKTRTVLIYDGDKLLSTADLPSGESVEVADKILSLLKSNGG